MFIRYLNITEYLQGNLGQDNYAAHDFFPRGYPRLLQLLNEFQLLNPLVITSINIVSSLGAASLVASLLNIRHRFLFLSLVLLSFLYVKQYTLPIADQIFTLLFVTSIFCWTLSFSRRWRYAIPAILFTVLAVWMRTAGIALIPGILLYGYFNFNLYLSQKKRILFLAIFASAFFFVFLFNLNMIASKIEYFRQLDLKQLVQQPFNIADRAFLHFKELGELTLNLPYSKIASSNILPVGFLTAVTIAMGIATSIVSIRSVIKLKLYHTLIFWVYLIYIAMVFVWPFYDTRFFTPVIPVLIYLVISSLSDFKAKFLKTAFLSNYILWGFVSLLYSDALSLNETYFLDHYGSDPKLTEDYRIHFDNKKRHVEKAYSIEDQNVLYLLQQYDKR